MVILIAIVEKVWRQEKCILFFHLETAMGQNINAQKNTKSEYVTAVAR